METKFKIGDELSVFLGARRNYSIFDGKVTSIREIIDREFLLYRLEDARGNYYLAWENELMFTKDVPKYVPPTEEERGKEKQEYFSSYRG